MKRERWSRCPGHALAAQSGRATRVRRHGSSRPSHHPARTVQATVMARRTSAAPVRDSSGSATTGSEGLVNGASPDIRHQAEGANPVDYLAGGVLFRIISLQSCRLELGNVREVGSVKFRIIRFKPLWVEPTPPISRLPSGNAIDSLRDTDRQLDRGFQPLFLKHQVCDVGHPPRLLDTNVEKPPSLLHELGRRRQHFVAALYRTKRLEPFLRLSSLRKLVKEAPGLAHGLSDLVWRQREVLSDEALVSQTPMQERLAVPCICGFDHVEHRQRLRTAGLQLL